MLRITTHDTSRILTFQLEGRLEGPWVEELEATWRSTLQAGRTMVRVDLGGVTFIDAAGKAGLKAMHKQGAQFLAGDCLTKAIVEEITSTKSSS